MSTEKRDQLLSGQTTIAQRVYQAVPIQDRYTPVQIKNEMARMGSITPDVKTIRGCLRNLIEAGLVRQYGRGQTGETFDRVPVRPVTSGNRLEKAKDAVTQAVHRPMMPPDDLRQDWRGLAAQKPEMIDDQNYPKETPVEKTPTQIVAPAVVMVNESPIEAMRTQVVNLRLAADRLEQAADRLEREQAETKQKMADYDQLRVLLARLK